MSLCPCCGRACCDHTPEERGQTIEEMLRTPSEEEFEALNSEPSDSQKKIKVARKHQHDPA